MRLAEKLDWKVLKVKNFGSFLLQRYNATTPVLAKKRAC
jgi:hypothetical protein